MNTMQKFMKKNNKGFSLVELIVVILIIGILAVAIAPQVTKWVGTATKNQETNEKANLISAAQVAAAELGEDTVDFDGTYTVTTDGKVSGGVSKFETKLTEILTGSQLKEKRTLKISGGAITVS